MRIYGETQPVLLEQFRKEKHHRRSGRLASVN